MLETNNIDVSKPYLSICIPSFNRAEKTVNLVRELLRCESREFEVIVLDNGSTDNTLSLLSQITDQRFFLSKNEINLGGPINHLKVLTLGRGNFAILCLDKDRIEFKKIPDLINTLRNEENVVFGHCSLNLVERKPDLYYESGYESLINNSYLSAHPTGMFYKIEILKRLNKLQEIFDKKEVFGFYPDIINGEMAVYGRSMVINIPICFTEKIDECADVKSFTYTEKNLFFSPEQRIRELRYYLDAIENLPFKSSELYIIIKKKYISGLSASTFGYLSILQNSSVCQHYGIETRNVGLSEIFQIASKYSSNFLTEKSILTVNQKKIIINFGWGIFVLKVLVKAPKIIFGA